MIRYKIDIMQALKNAGLSSYKLRHEKIIGESIMTKYRNNIFIGSTENINFLCSVLKMQPGDLLEYIPDDSDQ